LRTTVEPRVEACERSELPVRLDAELHRWTTDAHRSIFVGFALGR
jgi:hypothetical protein